MLKEVFVFPTYEFDKSCYRFFCVVADIGGTNSYFAVFGVKSDVHYDLLYKHYIPTKEISEIHQLLNEILKQSYERFGIEISRCCICAAGPVSRKRDHIRLMNAGLEIKKSEILSNTLLAHVGLINDFEAIGFGLDCLDFSKDIFSLKPDVAGVFGNTRAVIGAGTGLGMSIAYYNRHKHLYVPLPSEGGHMDFAPYGDDDRELLEFLKKKHSLNFQPEYEILLSGRGFGNIYDFLRSKNNAAVTELVKRIDSANGDEKFELIDSGYGKDELCTKTIDLFAKYYARAAKNLALVSECYGGLFLDGKIVLKKLAAFKDSRFIDEFHKHAREEALLRKVPVFVIMNTNIGLYGCCNVITNFYNLL
ncbi:glucokinase [Candidatus Woesearchaeota archaeon]|nr:glucokinase [Candidatus Woesearchaeota archaeon]